MLPAPAPAPHEVFTPGSLPLAPLNIYSPRSNAEAALRRFMERYNRDDVPARLCTQPRRSQGDSNP